MRPGEEVPLPRALRKTRLEAIELVLRRQRFFLLAGFVEVVDLLQRLWNGAGEACRAAGDADGKHHDELRRHRGDHLEARLRNADHVDLVSGAARAELDAGDI